jgi:nicotinamidase-related amidase
MERTVFPGFDFPIAARAALLVIDMQPCMVRPEAGLVQAIERIAPGYARDLTTRVRELVIPSTLRLLDTFHRLRRPVYFTVFASATGDGRDVTTATIRYRDAERRARTGQSVVLPRSDLATDVVAELAPRPGDRVLTKTSMDVFASTRLAEELRVDGIETLVITGVLTDAGVESSARHAAECGFQVIVVDDACAAWEEGFHAASLRVLSRYFARIASTGEVVSGIERAAEESRPR